MAEVSTLEKDCSKGGNLYVDVLMTPADRSEMLFVGQAIETGALTELKNIFYDFDEYLKRIIRSRYYDSWHILRLHFLVISADIQTEFFGSNIKGAHQLR